MKIKTITCHDVYNLGASLQAYALSEYLRREGHDVQIIDYKPLYLRHYRLAGVPNPRFDKPFLREAYQIAKFPGRLWERLTSPRKKAFDRFTAKYLPVTEKTYDSCGALAAEPPEAEGYIAGSDQIWNPVFPNGKDPAFFLDFVPEGKRKLSYAASFAVESLSAEDRGRMKPWLEKLDAISVRERSAVDILRDMGLSGVQVLDPVFLLPGDHWEKMAVLPPEEGYLLVYDFDRSPVMATIARSLAERTGKRIVSVFPLEGADAVWQNMGPLEFLGAVRNADTVLSNSFHATAFSLIFRKEFYVLNREEKINTRMWDLLGSVGLEDRLIASCDGLTSRPICWESTEEYLAPLIGSSKDFLRTQI